VSIAQPGGVARSPADPAGLHPFWTVGDGGHLEKLDRAGIIGIVLAVIRWHVGMHILTVLPKGGRLWGFRSCRSIRGGLHASQRHETSAGLQIVGKAR